VKFHECTPRTICLTHDDVDIPSATPTQSIPASDFYGNDVTLNPVSADLSKKQSVYMISQNCWDLRRNIIKKWYDEFVEKNGEPPSDEIDMQLLPPAMTGAFFMCDGQPAAQLSARLQLITIDTTLGM
jgi:hypothetical protein